MQLIEKLDEQAERRRIEIDGCGVVWRVFGRGSPLVLIHGGYGSWLHWIRNVEELARHYRVLVPDVPGHGDSNNPPARWEPQWLAHALTESLRQLIGNEPLSGVGFSMGGVLFGPVARSLGTQLEQVVLIGPNGMQLPHPEIENLRSLRSLGPAPRPEQIAEVHRHNLGQLMIRDEHAVDPLAVEIQTRNLARRPVNTEMMPTSDILVSALPDIRATIHGIWGEFDAFVGPYLASRRETLMRFQADLDFRVVIGAGHWVMYERPDEVNDHILEMLHS
ncbi:MAG: alpha/beta hydrolase [Pseudomonadota bacterium]